MTSEQHMPPGWHSNLNRASLITLLIMLGTLAGCFEQRLNNPTLLRAPYGESQLWAVAPFFNESGTTLVETFRISDLFVEQVQQVKGLDALPLNRVIVAMRQLDLEHIESPADASTLMRTLGVDGLLVGTVTSYDPYPPPKLGLAIALFKRNTHGSYSDLDPRALTKAMTDSGPTGLGPERSPVAQAAGVFDASNHQTLQWLHEYARGRTQPDSAYGESIYLASMELFTQFVSFRLMHDLLLAEQEGISPVADDQPTR